MSIKSLVSVLADYSEDKWTQFHIMMKSGRMHKVLNLLDQ
jgi:hypothetical protein